MAKKRNIIKHTKKFFAVLLTACILAGGIGGTMVDSGIVTAQAATLSAPSISISNSGTNVTLSWSKVSGATSYKIYYTTTAANAASKVGTQIGTTTSTSYTDTRSKTTGTPYYYFVVACKGSTTSSQSNVKGYIKLATPSISALTSSTNKITASWASVKNADKYQIYRSTSTNFTSDSTTVGSTTSTKYTASSLTSGKTYYFKVRAYKTLYGKTYYSSWSTVKSAKPN